MKDDKKNKIQKKIKDLGVSAADMLIAQKNEIIPPKDRYSVCKFTEAMGEETLTKAFEVFKKSVENGDKEAINTCIKKLFPDPKPRNYIKINFSRQIETLKDLIKAYDEVLLAMFDSQLSVEDALVITNILNSRKELLILAEIEPRLNFLEDSLKKSTAIDVAKSERVLTLEKERESLKKDVKLLGDQVKRLEDFINKNKATQSKFKKYT
jgi:hypothetical protein